MEPPRLRHPRVSLPLQAVHAGVKGYHPGRMHAGTPLNRAKTQGIRTRWPAFRQPRPDNQRKDKRVESFRVRCLDGGSTPPISTRGLATGDLLRRKRLCISLDFRSGARDLLRRKRRRISLDFREQCECRCNRGLLFVGAGLLVKASFQRQTCSHKKCRTHVRHLLLHCIARKDRDSNPGYPLGVHALSRRASSATRASFLRGCKYKNNFRFANPRMNFISRRAFPWPW